MRYFQNKSDGGVYREDWLAANRRSENFVEVQVVPMSATVVELPEVRRLVEGWGAEGRTWDFENHEDIEKAERRLLAHLAAVRAEREWRALEAKKAEQQNQAVERARRRHEKDDVWAGCDRAEIIRQAEASHARVQALHDALDRVKERSARKDEALRELHNRALRLEGDAKGLLDEVARARS